MGLGLGTPGADKQPRWADSEVLLLCARCRGAALPGSVFRHGTFYTHESRCQLAHPGPPPSLGSPRVAFLKVA